MTVKNKGGRPPIDITGKSFGRLTAIERVGSDLRQKSLWKFRCACGTEKIIKMNNVRSGSTQSCGCLASEITSKRSTTHGHTIGHIRSPEWIAWSSMLQRCFDKNCKAYPEYGGRGITVCDRWRHSFENFLEDMKEKPSRNHSLDRFPDGDGNYEPSNCRWATRKEQTLNRAVTKFITYNGQTLCIADWARVLGIKITTLWARINRGMTLEGAIHAKRSPATGIKNGNAKLNNQQVSDIKGMARNGMTNKKISSHYGVSEGLISCIRTGKIWKHIQ